jgi:hypothetical protein
MLSIVVVGILNYYHYDNFLAVFEIASVVCVAAAFLFVRPFVQRNEDGKLILRPPVSVVATQTCYLQQDSDVDITRIEAEVERMKQSVEVKDVRFLGMRFKSYKYRENEKRRYGHVDV